jgi:ATP/maltotriose-dependent transcriptional regulator MalT
MDVDFTPSTSDLLKPLINTKVIRIDCIDLNTEHLKRPHLVETLTELVNEYQFVRLTSPAASGKSSLLRLYQHSLKNSIVKWISCLDSKSCHQLL